MPEWRAKDSDESHDRFTKAIVNTLAAKLLRACGGGCAILSVKTSSPAGHDYRDVVVDLELPGNVQITVDCWRDPEAEAHPLRRLNFGENVAEVAAIVIACVQTCQYHGFETLAGILDEAWRDARSFSSQMPIGIRKSMHLLAVRFVFKAIWVRSNELLMEAEYASLDHWLRPFTYEIEVVDPAEITAHLRALCYQFGTRALALHRFEQHGATGEIDLLAINALKRCGNLVSELKRDPSEFGAPSSQLEFDCGRISLRTGIDSTPDLFIRGDKVHVECGVLPKAVLTNAIGKQITQIIDCALFSEEMVVIDAYRGFLGDSVVIEVQQPRMFYCKSSGCYWGQNPQ
ncbi:hypothetical protein [Citromicrobium bathyomarinum]|uniref:hypothetical protein n=1 Tax=Citromicrobium bathyomarinum TaxID=72174 RepID=UPI003159B373